MRTSKILQPTPSRNTEERLLGKTQRFEIPHISDDLLDNIDGDGSGVNQFAEKVFDGVAREGRVGILVTKDYEEGDPYFRLYDTDSIINWSGGRGEGSWVVLLEHYADPNASSKYERKTLDQYVEYSVRGGILYKKCSPR